MSILALDAGTTGVTALIVSDTGHITARGYKEFTQYFPQSGWVEHDPEEIWQACRTTGSTYVWEEDELSSLRADIRYQPRALQRTST